MAQVLLLSPTADDYAHILPGLSLLPHDTGQLPLEASQVLARPEPDLIVIDARQELSSARMCCRTLRAAGSRTPILVIMAEGGFIALDHQWGCDDVVLPTAGPAEIDARIRLLTSRTEPAEPDPKETQLQAGDLIIDPGSYSAKLRGRNLDLTYREFELLRYLAQTPGRVHSRSQLLQEVWGYDYYGGTRTVDVHIRRLRSKLGSDAESLIATIRNVGYRFDLPTAGRARSGAVDDGTSSESTEEGA